MGLMDPTAYGHLDDDEDVLMAQEDAESVSEEESADEESNDPYDLNPPPAYGHPDDGERPPFVLLETDAYYADRRNATTATCDINGLGGTVQVTFCVAQPPLVSYLCVHVVSCSLAHPDCATVEPQIIATETNGGLVLLRIAISEHPPDVMLPFEREYFIYDASGPSLQHLPRPGYYFNEDSVAIVRKCNKRSHGSPRGSSHDCSNCDYVLAAQASGFVYEESPHLCVYHSDLKTWSKVPVVVKSHTSHTTRKTLTIGGTVAWVDLWRNILLCDVLDERPMIRTLQLPQMPMPIMSPDNLGRGNPRSVRDIAVLDGGLIKYVELQYRRVEHGVPGVSFPYIWRVAVWSISTAGSYSSEDWHMDYVLDSIEMSSLPRLRVDEGTAQPTLSTLHIGLPNLSLQDDGVVYFLTKIHFLDDSHIAWVLAVDMRNKTVQKVGEFDSLRTAGLEEVYSASRISKYLKGAKQNTKQPARRQIISHADKDLNLDQGAVNTSVFIGTIPVHIVHEQEVKPTFRTPCTYFYVGKIKVQI